MPISAANKVFYGFVQNSPLAISSLRDGLVHDGNIDGSPPFQTSQTNNQPVLIAFW